MKIVSEETLRQVIREQHNPFPSVDGIKVLPYHVEGLELFEIITGSYTDDHDHYITQKVLHYLIYPYLDN